MNREVKIPVSCEPISITPGEWCPTCALPSALSVEVAVSIGDHLGVTTWHQCPECHHLWPVPEPA